MKQRYGKELAVHILRAYTTAQTAARYLSKNPKLYFLKILWDVRSISPPNLLTDNQATFEKLWYDRHYVWPQRGDVVNLWDELEG